MSKAKSANSKSRSSRSQAVKKSFLADYITVFFVLAGSVAIGSSTFSYIQQLFPDSCMSATGFNCVFGPFELANALGLLLFVGLGYWLLSKCLRITSFKRLVFGALVALVFLYLGDRYLFSQINTTTDLPHGLYFHMLWSHELIAVLLGAAAVFVPFHTKSK
ncbi:MAG TPA: hypothetical protein VLG47_07925 [Candidatus Saccharimonadales bacterium]|nr:hypothetical protein [Candidatus Saccharimonadales bacterium]